MKIKKIIKWFFLVIILLVILLFGIKYLQIFYYNISPAKTVSLEEDFIFHVGQTINIDGYDITIKLDKKRLVCTLGDLEPRTCSNRLSTESYIPKYNVKYKEKDYSKKTNIFEVTPFIINITDKNIFSFKTVISIYEKDCYKEYSNRPSNFNDCLIKESFRWQDSSYCYQIQESPDDQYSSTADSCLSRLATFLEDSSYCEGVVQPTNLCLYNKIIENKEIIRCHELGNSDFAENCFGNLIEYYGYDENYCSTVSEGKLQCERYFRDK